MNSTYNTECALLNTMLQCEYFYGEKPFKLDERFFNYPYNKSIVKQINEAIDKGKSLSLLAFMLQDKTAGTKYEQDFISIIHQNPLTIEVAHKYHRLLKELFINKKAGLLA